MITPEELEKLIESLPEPAQLHTTLVIYTPGRAAWFITRRSGGQFTVAHDLALKPPVHLRGAGAVVDLLTGKAAPTPADLIAAAPYRITCE